MSTYHANLKNHLGVYFINNLSFHAIVAHKVFQQGQIFLLSPKHMRLCSLNIYICILLLYHILILELSIFSSAQTFFLHLLCPSKFHAALVSQTVSGKHCLMQQYSKYVDLSRCDNIESFGRNALCFTGYFTLYTNTNASWCSALSSKRKRRITIINVLFCRRDRRMKVRVTQEVPYDPSGRYSRGYRIRRFSQTH